MRCFALALAMMAGLASVTWAADRPSQQVLSDMGLGGLTILSDSQSLAVRGFGYSPTRAAGWGFAVVSTKNGSAGSFNSYSAKGQHKSWGENYSEAGVEITNGGGQAAATAAASTKGSPPSPAAAPARGESNSFRAH